MADIKLDPVTGDIDMNTLGEGGVTLSYVDGADAIRQNWRARMLMLRGEWFLDQRLGVPYFEQVLIKAPNFSAVRAVFRRITLDTKGIASVSKILLELDNATRRMTITIEGLLSDNLGPFVYEELLYPLTQSEAV